jgi:hypothetical protein
MRVNVIYVLIFVLFANITFADESLRPTRQVDYINAVRLPATESKRVIDDIIDSHDLKGEKITTKWKLAPFDFKQPKNEQSEWVKAFSVIFATLIEYALWILLAVGIVLLYLSRHQWLYLLLSKKEPVEVYQTPDILFGMDVREASLPDDIIATAKQLWQQQQVREALSVLYRGTLVRLINHEKILLENSHTEGDILKLSQNTLAENKQYYLKQLTAQWQLVAYAHRIPTDDAMAWLFAHWASDFSYASNVEDGL